MQCGEEPDRLLDETASEDAQPRSSAAGSSFDFKKMGGAAAGAFLVGVGCVVGWQHLFDWATVEEEDPLMGSRVLDQLGIVAPEGFQLRAQGSTCSNWQSIQLGELSFLNDVGECGKRCKTAFGCTGFAFMPGQCSEGGVSLREGACRLWGGTCESVLSGCWDDYVAGSSPESSPSFELRRTQTTCSNWKEVGLDNTSHEHGAEACAGRCKKTKGCVGFGYLSGSSDCAEQDAGNGACRLWGADCKDSHDECWNDYRMSAGVDDGTMLLPEASDDLLAREPTDDLLAPESTPDLLASESADDSLAPQASSGVASRSADAASRSSSTSAPPPPRRENPSIGSGVASRSADAASRSSSPSAPPPPRREDPSAPQPAVMFSIENLSIEALEDDDDLMGSLKDELQTLIAAKAGFEIQPGDVKVDLLKGSGSSFEARVEHLPDGVDDKEVALNLNPSQDFVVSLAMGVSQVPGIQLAATGSMNLVMGPVPTAPSTPAPTDSIESSEKGAGVATWDDRDSLASFDVSGLDADVLSTDEKLMSALLKYIKQDVSAQTGLALEDIVVTISS